MERIRRLLSVPPALARALRVAASLAVLIVVARIVGGREVLSRLATADPALLAAAFLALNVQTVLCAVRWRLTAARLGQRIGLRRAVAEYYLAQLVNQVVPGGVVGDVGRAARARHAGGLLRAGQAVALERLSGQLALVVVGLAAIGATAVVPGGLAWPPPVGLAIVAVVLAFGLLRWLSQRRSLRRKVPGVVTDGARLAWQALAAPDVRYRQIVLSFGTAACNIVAFVACARATGTDLSFGAAAALVPLVLVAMLIPIGIAGWGFREGAAAALLPLAGATAGAGAAASVAFGVVLLMSSLPGLIPLAIAGGSRTRGQPPSHTGAAASAPARAATATPRRP